MSTENKNKQTSSISRFTPEIMFIGGQNDFNPRYLWRVLELVYVSGNYEMLMVDLNGKRHHHKVSNITVATEVFVQLTCKYALKCIRRNILLQPIHSIFNLVKFSSWIGFSMNLQFRLNNELLSKSISLILDVHPSEWFSLRQTYSFFFISQVQIFNLFQTKYSNFQSIQEQVSFGLLILQMFNPQSLSVF